MGGRRLGVQRLLTKPASRVQDLENRCERTNSTRLTGPEIFRQKWREPRTPCAGLSFVLDGIRVVSLDMTVFGPVTDAINRQWSSCPSCGNLQPSIRRPASQSPV